MVLDRYIEDHPFHSAEFTSYITPPLDFNYATLKPHRDFLGHRHHAAGIHHRLRGGAVLVRKINPKSQGETT